MAVTKHWILLSQMQADCLILEGNLYLHDSQEICLID